jgi:hypothetical protein
LGSSFHVKKGGKNSQWLKAPTREGWFIPVQGVVLCNFRLVNWWNC